jgi:uncharacterized protein
MQKPGDLVQNGLEQWLNERGELAVRVTPKAAKNRVTCDPETGEVRVYVTVVPEGGKANAAVIKLLAKEFGIAKTRFNLIRGQTSRDKVFAVLDYSSSSSSSS